MRDYKQSCGIISRKLARNVVQNTVAPEASVDVVALLQEAWTLVVDATLEDAGGIVPRCQVLERDREVFPFTEVVKAQGMCVVAASGPPLRHICFTLVFVRLHDNIKRLCHRINHPCANDPHMGTYISAHAPGQEQRVSVYIQVKTW